IRFSQSAPQSRIVSHPHQNRSKNRTDFAAAQRRQANATGLHSCGQPGSHGRRGENAYSNSQPRGGPKRTESGPWKDHIRVSYSAFIGLRRRRSAHFVSADCERTETERGHCPKSFGMMVARDGVEPPTPAFSGILPAYLPCWSIT